MLCDCRGGKDSGIRLLFSLNTVFVPEVKAFFPGYFGALL